MFLNRQEAGRRLAQLLEGYANRANTVVLGIPRGGVPVAFELASSLHLPMDIFVIRKLGVPGHEELAFGAIASGGVRVLNWDVVAAAGLSNLDIERVTRDEQIELERREHIYRNGHPAINLDQKTAIIADDGIATGASLRAGIHALQLRHPSSIVIAVPVAPESAVNLLSTEADEVVCVEVPLDFYGVGQFYQDFSQVSDEEVKRLLKLAHRKELPERVS